MDNTEKQEFTIQREKVERYLYYSHILMILLIGIWYFGIGIIVAIVHALTLGPWLSKKQVEALSYWLEGNTLRADSGVFFLKRKAIPLDRITDIVIAQGPLLKKMGIWQLRIQTSGMGSARPEALLYGLEDPEQIRDLLIKERDRVISNKK